MVMGAILSILGAGLAGFAGYTGLSWIFIFISSALYAIGYFIIRAPQIRNLTADGSVAKLFLIQLVIYSIVTGPIYFIASLLS